MATGKYGGNPPWKGKKGIAGIAATMGPGDSRSSASYSPFSTSLSPNITNYTTAPPRTAPLGYGGIGPLKAMGNATYKFLTETMGMSPSKANIVLQVLSTVTPGVSEAKGLGDIVNLLGSDSGSDPLANPLEEGSGGLSPESIQNMETAGALSRISSGVYNAPGGDSTKSVKGRNAAMRGTHRARVKEQKAYKRAVKNAAMKYDPAYWVESLGIPLEMAEALAADFKSKYSPEYFANIMKEKNMGLGSVMKESWDSFADSRGVPYNIDELMANYEETGELLPGSGGDG
jgi:hypothetical protein